MWTINTIKADNHGLTVLYRKNQRIIADHRLFRSYVGTRQVLSDGSNFHLLKRGKQCLIHILCCLCGHYNSKTDDME